MRDPIETCAWISISRGCGFAGLATFCGMIGISFNLALSLKFGGYCALLTCATLLLMAARASHVRYSHTETWLLLAEGDRPPKPIAQAMITGARRRVLYLFASYAARAAVFMLTASLLVQALRGG